MKPVLVTGGSQTDTRGRLFYNNDFDASLIKRIYMIENQNTDFVRAWQGHKIEQRWFSAVNGSFEIKLIEIDHWDKPNPNLECETFQLKSGSLDILHIPSGFVSSIKALEENSRLLLFADYFFNEVSDEYRYHLNYFENAI
jgi:dTDP-4-dehydrorhamnose 3,5-epimerase-like enzyme